MWLLSELIVLPPHLRRAAHQRWREQQTWGMEVGKQTDRRVRPQRELGSIRPVCGPLEFNIHLAWCIPRLETLMWFVGESRWEVHGSTLLTDGTGANGQLHNNAQCLSSPSVLPDIPVNVRILRREPFGVLKYGGAPSAVWFSCFPPFRWSFSWFCPSSFPPLCGLCTSPLSYFIILTPTPARLMHMPLDWSHIILWLPFAPSITPLNPVSSPPPVLPPSTYQSIGNLLPRPPTPVQKRCHATKLNPSTFVSAVGEFVSELNPSGHEWNENLIRIKHLSFQLLGYCRNKWEDRGWGGYKQHSTWLRQVPEEENTRYSSRELHLLLIICKRHALSVHIIPSNPCAMLALNK